MTDNNNTPVVVEQEEQDIGQLAQIRRDKLSQLIDSGNNPYEITTFDQTHHSQQILDNFDTLEGQRVTIAGRMMSRRIMGKASFAHVRDGQGTIQIYIRRDDIAEGLYAQFKTWDLGDIVGASGTVFRTKMGEISVHVDSIVLLSKGLLPLPEKWHGLKDTDTRYRQRYLDLIVNPDVKQAFVVRSAIIKHIRAFMDNRQYMEVETPILNSVASGANARPFITHHNTLDMDMYLRIAPELYLKRLIVGGFERVYEIGKMFRNEGMDVRHNPEFTMMESYQAYTDYHGIMELVESLFKYVSDNVLGTRQVSYEDTIIDMDNWTKLSMVEAVKLHTGVDFDQLDDTTAVAKAKELGCPVDKSKQTWGYALYEVFDQLVEGKLIQPTFIYDYPIEVSPLTKKKPSDHRLTERFEFFIMSREMGNAYSELNDPIDQASRFAAQDKQKDAGDDESMMNDDDFVTALEYGMPPTGGLGIGIDRMVMLFTDSHSIRDVLLFPTMKPQK